MSDRDLEEAALAAYRRLIERASRAVTEAVEETEKSVPDPALDPEPCP